jgi:hypothetical protein
LNFVTFPKDLLTVVSSRCDFLMHSGDKTWTRAFLYLGQPPSYRDRTKKEGGQTSLPRAEFEPAPPLSNRSMFFRVDANPCTSNLGDGC